MEAMIEVEGAPLTLTEEQQLAADEAVIERGLRTFYEVGAALADIRDNRLYRQAYRNFEDYCRERWGFGKDNAKLLIRGAHVVENLKEMGIMIPNLPANNRQAWPLAVLPDEQQAAVWQQIMDTAPDGKITSGHVMRVVEGNRQVTPMAVHFSSATPEWYTPQSIIDIVSGFFDEIDLDPCSNSHESPNVPAHQVFTQEDDGLTRAWWGRVYMNPPYGDGIGAWVNKLCDAYDTGEIEAGIALLPGRIDTRWFRRLRPYAVCFLWGRLQFVGADNSAPFPSILVYLGDEIHRFQEATAEIGDVWVCVGTEPGDRQLEHWDEVSA